MSSRGLRRWSARPSIGSSIERAQTAGCPACAQGICLRYLGNMTDLLEKALRRVESLSREEQDAIASQIMETLDDEEAWARSFREKPAVLRSLAREALEEHRRGETRPLDELLG